MRVVLMGLAVLAGCSADKGTVLQITGTVAASGATCAFDPGSTPLSISVFDPTGGTSYVAGLVVKNNVGSSVTDSAKTGDTELKTEANAVTLQTLEACFFDSRDATALEAKDCEAVSEGQKRTLPVTGSIGPGGGQAAVGVTLMTPADLQLLYTSDFQPELIPIVGSYIEDSNGDGDTDDAEDRILFSYEAQDRSPTDICEELEPGDDETPCRAQAWGNYPSSGTVRVVWRVRMHGEFQSGGKVETDWFTLAIELCPHCLNDACDVLQGGFCLEACDGDPCVLPANTTSEAARRCRLDTDASCQNVCGGLIACFPFAFKGTRPDLSASCAPYQLSGSITCSEYDECTIP